MACLAATSYDPTSAVTKASDTLRAMTAIDTTNLRLTFTAPANGTVMVRMRCCTHGSSTSPMIFLGVLDGATVKGRIAPITDVGSGAGSQRTIREAQFLVTGLTPGTAYTWDAAWAVQVVVASGVTGIKYGGPNDTSSDNAFGGFDFSIWETVNLLAGKLYDPGTAVSASTASLLAMTALDTTNLRLTFTAPSSGRVLVRLQTLLTGATGTKAQTLLGVLDGATVKGRSPGVSSGAQIGTAAATDYQMLYASFMVTGLSPGSSFTWDAAYSVELILASTNIKYGGPDDATGNDAWGGFAYEIWAA
jgi:hypothetical protein